MNIECCMCTHKQQEFNTDIHAGAHKLLIHVHAVFHEGRLYVISDLSSDTEQALVPVVLNEKPHTCKINKIGPDEGSMQSVHLYLI